MTGLTDRWHELIPDSAPLAEELAARYTDRDRQAYRDRYLETILTALDSLDQLSTDPTAVRLAVWFHRAVHAAGAQPADDAEASAVLAEELLPSYDVSSARIAEVARLVRLTGGDAATAPGDPNADVFLDAVNATLAADHYADHASEVRRDANTPVKERHAVLRAALAAPLYRTQLARDRFDRAARQNLSAELAILDAQLPAPWRGWQQAGLVALAGFGAFSAFVLAFVATQVPWRIPEFGSDQLWLAIVLTVLALAAVPLLLRFSRRNGRTARIVDGGVISAGVLGLVAVLVLAPDTNPSVGIGERAPLLLTASILLITAGAAAVAASAAAGARIGNRAQLLARIVVPVAVVLAMVFITQPLWRIYSLNANEFLDGPHGPAAPGVRSELTGDVAWSSRSNGYNSDSFGRAVSTRYGIATTRRTATVEMLDAATGESRWRYTRSDASGLPDLSVIGNGELLLAHFDNVGYLLLDADTGKRKAAWPGRTQDHDIQNADPLLTEEQVGKGSNKLRGVDTDGGDRWTFEPGRCTRINAVATADTAVAFLGRSCGKDPDELAALDLRTGEKLWSRAEEWAGSPFVAGSLVVGLKSDRELVGMDARSGELKWRWPLPSALGCKTRVEQAGDKVVLLNCPPGADKTQTVVTAIDAGTGVVSWQRTAPIDVSRRVAVTADARVVTLKRLDTCKLQVVEESGFRQVPASREIFCNQGVRAVGDVVLARGSDGLIALR
ncbi:PQQ-binding-like beta-propeller repeat protein [Kribbella sp. CA-294648]|uniref:outer membrane protein assembly factor BamB family protein n=1 Tax=Kribbella sp. CA-294648 TaxID=3239948 RepID=UPI003D93F270